MTTNDLASLSQVAFASYFDLITGVPNVTVLQDSGNGMAPSQAEDFSKKYTVVVPTYHHPMSDLDATVFEDGDGNLTLGIRGTLTVHDKTVTDVQIALNGAGYDQIVALYNWWQLVSNPAGVGVSQFVLTEYPNANSVLPPVGAVKLFDTSTAFGGRSMYLAAAPSVSATGEVSTLLAADPDHKIDVTGHSMGAHLTLAFNALFGSSVGQAVGFDTPGFANTSVNEQFFSALGGAVPTSSNSGNFVSVIADQASVGSKPFNAIAGLWSRPGVAVDIAIENQWQSDEPVPEFPVYNHSMKILADSLAIYGLLSTLDPNLSTAKYKTVLDSAANGSAGSYERIVDALEAVFNVNQGFLSVGNDQRSVLYDALYGVHDALQPLVGKVRIDLSSGNLMAKARNDFSALASLITLSPVVLTGTDSTLDSFLHTAWGTTYTDWKTDKSMSEADRAAGKETYTDSWIADRSHLLNALGLQNQRNSTTGVALDSSVPVDRAYEFRYYGGAPPQGETQSPFQTLIADGHPGAVKRSQLIAFGNESSNQLDGSPNQLGDRLYGGAGDDTLKGLAGDDYLEGNAGDDRLDGGEGADTLLGGAGDDTVAGGIGNDTLLGGAGVDDYRFDSGWGFDTIQDSDGEGSIVVTGLGTLSGAGATKISDNAWQSADRQVYYTLATVSSTRDDLYVTFADRPDVILLRDWSDSKLGISLPGEIIAPQTSNTLAGDFSKQTTSDTYVITGGNYVSDGKQADTADVITGSGVGDSISGLGGNDGLSGGAGDDFISGGAGADLLFGGMGRDTLDGGAGDDFIFGSAGGPIDRPTKVDFTPPAAGGAEYARGFSWVAFDPGAQYVQFAGANPHTLEGDAGNVIDGGTGNDFIAAGSGADTVHGGDDDDYIAGLAGNDVLFGDAGADHIVGDGNDAAGFVSTVPGAEHGNDILVGAAGADILAGQGGDDELYGGTEDDQLFGDDSSPLSTPYANHGNDYLDAGDGSDELVGGGKDDVLYGGTGNDRLWGDATLANLDGQYHGQDHLDGEDGDDYLEGGGEDDFLAGGTGDDMLWGDASNSGLTSNQYGTDYLSGEEGDDILVGGGKADSLFGGDGADLLIGDGVDEVALADQGDDYLDGGEGDDKLVGDGGDDVLLGGAGDDSVDGGDGDDILLGGDGVDVLDGGDGDDLLDGGAGPNYLKGGEGNDTLVATTGYLEGGAGDDRYDLSGADGSSALPVIDDHQGQNTLVLGAATGQYKLYTQGGVTLLASAEGPLLAIAEGSDLGSIFVGEGVGAPSLLALAQQEDPSGQLHSMVSVNGELVDTASITANQALEGSGLADALNGGSGDDFLQGGSGDDLLSGGAGDDVIQGGSGADVIVGGGGDDVLAGSSTDSDAAGDIYRFEAGDGADRIDGPTGGGDGIARDVISFGNSVARNSVKFLLGKADAAAAHADLVIAYGQGDTLTLSTGALFGIAEIQFADGTSLSRDALLRQLVNDAPAGQLDVAIDYDLGSDLVLIGTPLADALYGGDGNDILIGGAGADVLAGGSGRNVYMFAGDSGADLILDSSGVLEFMDANLAQLHVYADAHDVVVVQTSGACVRIRDLLWPGSNIDDWKVIGADGTEVPLGGLFDPSGPQPNATLEARREEFVEKQFLELASSPQRVLGTTRYPTEPVTPTSAVQVVSSVGEAGGLAYEHYLTIDDTVQDYTFYVSTPIYETVRETVPATPGRFIKVSPDLDGFELPPGAVPVWRNQGDVRILLGFEVPGSPAGYRDMERLIGFESTPVEATRLVTNDTAIQSLVSGSNGNDLIIPKMASDGSPALFRGNIVVGSGDDQVLLATGDNIAGAPGWNRFQEWRATGFVESVATRFNRGRGAWIDLGEGNDIAQGSDANDFIIGGPGSDYMDGQAGADTYLVSYSAGDLDHISDLAYYVFWDHNREGPLVVAPYNDDIVEFDASVGRLSLSYRFVRSFAALTEDSSPEPVKTLQLFTNGQRFLDIDYLENTSFRWDTEHAGVEQFRFADGTLMSLDELLSSLPASTNAPPQLTSPISDHETAADQPFEVPVGIHFSDPDGDALLLTAELENGSPLPWFLFLDAATGMIGGSPSIGDAGSYSIRVRATDSNGLFAEGLFQLDLVTAEMINHAPTVQQALVAQSTEEDAAWTFVLPAGTFADVDEGDSLVYRATVSNGGVLPSWLDFDPVAHTFSGTPLDGDVGALVFEITATDQAGAQATSTFVLTISNVNDAPSVVTGIADSHATEDQLWTVVVPPGTFEDVDGGDTLTYSATLASGDVLPAWISFDPATRTFSGTPLNADVGVLNLKVTAADPAGAGASSAFGLTVANVNDAPTVGAVFGDQSAAETRSFSVQLPGNLFTDVDAVDRLSWSVQQAGGDALPAWLSFDGSARTLSGTPKPGDGGPLALRVTVTDSAGASSSQPFTVKVDRLPTLALPLGAQNSLEDHPWSFTVPATTFIDADPGDALSYSASLADGTALAPWLAFNGQTRTFQGTPLNADVGEINLKVTATDMQGLSVSSEFALAIANVNDAPVLSQPLGNQAASEDQPWNYTVPAGAFSEVDAGDALSYRATLASGAALPNWLSFNASSRTFSGTPLNADVGDVALTVVATDMAGASASANFTVTVANVNDAPVAVGALAAWSVVAGDAVSYTVPASAFTDVDRGDVLTYSANIGNGAALPSWLAFNPGTRAFSGTPSAGDNGDLVLKVTATDTGGLAAQQTIGLHVESGLILSGTGGNDVLTGRAGNDYLDGGVGADQMAGGKGDDIYVVDTGGDVVTELANEGIDLVYAGVTYTLPANVENLTLTGSALGPPSSHVPSGVALPTLPANSSAPGTNAAGNDRDNVLVGNERKNTLTGGAGNDTLDGGAGDDKLVGGIGNDTYILRRGYGADTITEDDTTAGNVDVARFADDIAYDQLWFRKHGNDLEVVVIGSNDMFSLQDWYKGSRYHVEQFTTFDGKTLLDSQVQNLVNAMASFNPPAAGQITLTADYQRALGGVLAANWH